MAAFVAASVAAAVIISSRLTPLYEATATLDLGRLTPSSVVGGNDGTLTAGSDATDRFVPTQVKLIQSDAVLRPVAEQLNLLTGPTDAHREAPVVLKTLRVTRPPNSNLIQISYRSPDPQLAAAVANEIANSYLQQTYRLRVRSLTELSGFMAEQIEELKLKMERSSAAVAKFERELDIIDPEQKSGILSARLLALNTEYADAQADRIRKEASYKIVSSGSIASAEAAPQGELLRSLFAQLEDAQQRFALVKTHYGQEHPEYQKASTDVDQLQRRVEETRTRIADQVNIQYRQALQRERMLQQTVAQTKDEFDELNARSFEYQRVRREADADRQLYEELVQRIKEAGINAGFQDSAIRIADTARAPQKPVFPNVPLNGFLAFLGASMLAVGLVLGRDYLGNSIADANEVELAFGIPVLAKVPALKSRERPMLTRLTAPQSQNLATTAYQESIRALYYSVLHSQSGCIRSLFVTSAAPNEGKTTISLQLAIEHASCGQKTLLVDTDSRTRVRQPHGAARGLADILRRGLDWRGVVVPSPALPHLHFLPAGTALWQATPELDRQLASFLESASREYDLIIIDSPPLLGFVESLEMSTVVDGVLVVACADRTKLRTLGSVLQQLARFRANVIGVVLNRADQEIDVSSYYDSYA